MKKHAWVLGSAAGVGLGLWLAGCDFGVDDVIRDVSLSVEGTYENGSHAIVTRNSGALVMWLAVRQDGDQLEAVDNNGAIFSGSLTEAVEGQSASFELDGSSTAGAEVTISGSFSISGTTSTMRGTWIEPALVGAVYGTAEVFVPTNAPEPTNAAAVLR